MMVQFQKNIDIYSGLSGNKNQLIATVAFAGAFLFCRRILVPLLVNYHGGKENSRVIIIRNRTGMENKSGVYFPRNHFIHLITVQTM